MAPRLTAGQVQELVEGYVSGLSTYELAERFGVQRQTVSRHLRLQGVEVRRRGLDEQGFGEVVRLYQGVCRWRESGSGWVSMLRPSAPSSGGWALPGVTRRVALAEG
ncbi:hypothetical protein GCM10027456_81840 [Kineosporia babensis]